MPIKSNLPPKHSFEPEEVESLQKAFDAVWDTDGQRVIAGQTYARDDIAKAIVDAAVKGERTLEGLIEAGKRVILR